MKKETELSSLNTQTKKKQTKEKKKEVEEKEEKKKEELNQEEEKEEEETESDSLLPSHPLVLTKEEKRLLSSNLEDDLFEVLKDVKYFAPLCAILFSFIGIYLALDPFTIYPTRPTPMSHDEFVSYYLFFLSFSLFFTYFLLFSQLF